VDNNSLNNLVGILILVLTAFGMIIGALQVILNRKVDRDTSRLEEAEKLTNISLNTSETLRGSLADANKKIGELEGELQKLRVLINGFNDRVLALEKVYDDLVARQREFLAQLNFVKEEIDDIIHGKIDPSKAASLVKERIR
jgi:chromosome segregation ATPase